jgi:hypothetical protein
MYLWEIRVNRKIENGEMGNEEIGLFNLEHRRHLNLEPVFCTTELSQRKPGKRSI